MSSLKKEKTSQKRKKESLSFKMNDKKLSKDELLIFLSNIITGNVKEFTGLPPSIETRMKAMDRYLSLSEEQEIKVVPEAIKIVVDDRTDHDRLEQLEKEVFGNVE
jgi:hypothetical protein